MVLKWFVTPVSWMQKNESMLQNFKLAINSNINTMYWGNRLAHYFIAHSQCFPDLVANHIICAFWPPTKKSASLEPTVSVYHLHHRLCMQAGVAGSTRVEGGGS